MTGNERIAARFGALAGAGRKALVPFMTAGDPSLEATVPVMHALVAAGADAIELGMPFSDPMADGPVIQDSYTRALGKKIKLASILEMLGETCPTLGAPAVTMVSYAIIYRHGVEKYCDAVASRGVAGLIVPDLPLDESAALAKVTAARGLSLIQLVTPTTPRDRAVRICETHSVRSTAPGLVQFATPTSSSTPTPVSHSRRPSSAFCRSSTTRFGRPVCAAPLRTLPFIAGTTVVCAQSASRFQTPQPPTLWRVQPVSP